MSGPVIPSLAILKVNWDAGKDYIENFVPFIAECLRTAPHTEVSLPELQTAVAEKFGLRIPQGALNTVLRRAARRGFAERTEGIYRRNEGALANLDLSRTRSDVLRKYEALIRKLVGFCRKRFKVEWTPEEADAALLANLETGSSAVLAAVVDGRVISRPEDTVPHANFFVSSFVVETYEGDPEGFEFLETVVKGSMLASALLFPDLGGISRRFDRLEVYFDTTWVIRALGLAGAGRQEPCRELIGLLYEQNASLRIFEHTLNEIRRVLDAALHAFRSPHDLRRAFGETIQHFIDSGYTASDIELAIARIEQSLRALHIRVKCKPPHTEALGLDEVKFASVLQDEVHYQHEEALFHDIDSLTAIHRIRQGQLQPRIESSQAIFVTTNLPLARGARRFLREEFEGYRDTTVPLCLLDHAFTTIVWLKKPLRAPDLPRKCIIADCYAAMNPPDNLWKQYLEEIDRLETRGDISTHDYNLLRFSLAARHALMDTTLGDVEPFAEGTVAQVLERAQAAARADTEAALAAERQAKLRAEHDAEARLTAERADAEAALAAEKLATAQAEARFIAHREAQIGRIRIVSACAARWVGLITLALGVALLAAGVFLTLPDPFPDLVGGRWNVLVPALLAAFGVLSFASLAFGANLRSLARRLEGAVARFLERILFRFMQP